MKFFPKDSREDLFKKMNEYYSSNIEYHDNIDLISGERPNIEEIVLFRAICDNLTLNSQPKILEIGCGSCESAAALISQARASDYYGVDPSHKAIELARQTFPHYHLSVASATKLDFENSYFDIVFLNYVLEHLVYPEKLLSEVARVVKPGGIIGMIVPVTDLPWMLPRSLRYRQKNIFFLVQYIFVRWINLLRIRYQKSFVSLKLVYKPIALMRQDNYVFQPDDDLVYTASSLEIVKLLKGNNFNVVFKEGRDITPYIISNRRKIVDLARKLLFLLLRLCLSIPAASEYTTTVTIVAKKNQ